MLTEAEARELLARAADTIEVPPGSPVLAPERPSRRRWMPLVAAGVPVVLVVGGLMLWNDQDTARPTPGEPPPTQAVVEPGADGRLPSVFAYSGMAAEDLLSGLGLTVTVRPEYTCLSQGRADHTEPTTGTRFQPGDEVKLFVTEPSPAANCVHPAPQALAWQLLDYANGRGPEPDFAPELSAWVDGEPAEVDLALSLLALASGETLGGRGTGISMAPTLSVGTGDSPEFACDSDAVPVELADRTSHWLGVIIATDGVGTLLGPCAFADVYLTDGQIDALVIRTSGAFGETAPPEPDPDPNDIGARFLAFARGETDSLPVDTPVRLYLGGEYQQTIEPADIGDPSAWEVCADYAGRSCPMSALTTLAEFDGRPAVTDFLPDGCLDPASAVSPTDTGGGTMVVLGVPEPRTCAGDFEVQVWSNDVDQIVAVNLLFGTDR